MDMAKPKIRFKGYTDDWEQRKLGDVLVSLQNNTLSRADLSNEAGVAKNVHYGDVLIKFGEVLDVSKEQLPMISDESILTKYKTSFLQNGDVIIADTAEDTTVGKCSEIVGLNDEVVLSGLHTIPYRPVEKFAPKYLGYYLNSDAYHNQLLPLMQGIKVTSISKSAMQDTDIIYPKSKEEQTEIGNYFDALDHLITLHQCKCHLLHKLLHNDWEQRKLGEVLDDMYNGQTPSRKRDEYWNGNIRWLSSGELNRGIVYSSIETITEEGKKSANLRVVPKGTFVMAITGLEASGTRGNCALLGFDTTLNQSCMALFPKQDILISQFLFQWYRMVGEEYGINYTQGTKQQSYNAELIKILPILLPSIDEQKKIASYLNSIDHLITLHQRKCEETKKLKKYMLQKMFPQNGQKVPEIRFSGFTDAWEQRKLEDIMDTVTDYVAAGSFEDIRNNVTYLNEPGYAQLVRTVDLKKKFTNNDSIYVDESAFKYLWRVNLNEECIVLPNIGANIGEVYFVEPSGLPYDNNVLGPNAILLKANEDTYFAFTALNNLTFQKQLFENVGSSGQPKFNKTELKSIQLYMPQNEEQEKIGQYFRDLDHLITLHQHKCEQLQSMKKFMLQNMFV